MEVLGPKGPLPYGGVDRIDWARRQVHLATQIIDNPGGGLVFATQTMGQVRSAFQEGDDERWSELVRQLSEAEERALWRDFAGARRCLESAAAELSR